jgi:hypothetical protein
VYALTSIALAQIGWLVIFDAYAAAQAGVATGAAGVLGPQLAVCQDRLATTVATQDPQ